MKEKAGVGAPAKRIVNMTPPYSAPPRRAQDRKRTYVVTLEGRADADNAHIHTLRFLLKYLLRRSVGPAARARIMTRVDPRLAVLARASARLILAEAGEIDLDEAFDGLVESICDCRRWPLAVQWEHTHPPRRRGRA
jgi:hypothetical protein